MEEVHDFLAEVREEMQALKRENDKLREQRERFGKELTDHENLDKTLKVTVANALSIMEECRDNAGRDATTIIKEAELKAENIVQEAQGKLMAVQQDINELKKVRKHFKDEMKKAIADHMTRLDVSMNR